MLRFGNGTTGEDQVLIDINTKGTSTSRGRLTFSDAGNLRGFLGIQLGDEEVTLLSNDNLILDCGNSDNIIMTSNSTAKVGIGDTTPSSKLSVAGGVQIANDTDSATLSKVGTFRYRTSTTGSFDYSHVDMCMQVDQAAALTAYEWVNVVTNRWVN